MAVRLPFAPPPIILYASYVSCFVVTISLALMLLPAKTLPKPARFLRTKLLAWWQRAKRLSVDGPFYRLLVWAGRRLGRGWLASRCQAPGCRAKPGGSREVEVTLTPHLGWNPWHQEQYFLAWCCVGEKEPKWRERAFDAETECEKVGETGKLKCFLEGLPEQSLLRVRACAFNVHGRGEWSKEVQARTLAPPSEENGLTGPLGPACEEGARYTWGQTKSDVTLKVPLRPTWTARNISIKWTASKFELRGPDAASDEILVGPLHKKIKVDEVIWTIEEETKSFPRHLQVQMVKVDPLEKWPCCLDALGHPHVDVRLLQLFKDELNGLGDLGACLGGMGKGS